MKITPALIIAFFLLAACSSDKLPTEESKGKENEQAMKYEVREPAFDPAKTVEPPKKPASSLDQ